MKHKVITVIRRITYLLVVILSLNSCETNKKENLTIDFLNVYFEKYRIENKVDSIFLGHENSNTHIFKRFKRELELETKDSNTTLINKIFDKREYENFVNQTIDSSSWKVDLGTLNKVYSSTLTRDKEKIIYVTQPIFTLDKTYALIYKYKKSDNDVYFIPSIEVFNKDKNSWEKVGTISHFK